jgi:hypothetical protein
LLAANSLSEKVADTAADVFGGGYGHFTQIQTPILQPTCTMTPIPPSGIIPATYAMMTAFAGLALVIVIIEVLVLENLISVGLAKQSVKIK